MSIRPNMIARKEGKQSHRPGIMIATQADRISVLRRRWGRRLRKNISQSESEHSGVGGRLVPVVERSSEGWLAYSDRNGYAEHDRHPHQCRKASIEVDAAERGKGHHHRRLHAEAKEHLAGSPLTRRILKPRQERTLIAFPREIVAAHRDI